MKGIFTFWAATKALLIAYRATIPHMKGDIQGFHMNLIAWMYLVKLRCYGMIIRLYDNALV